MEVKRYALDEHSTIVLAIERLNENLEKINDRHDRFEERIGLKMDKIQEDVSKFGTLFEKLLHVEKTHEENNKRVHHRIDDVVKRLDRIESLQNDVGCATLREFKKEIEPRLTIINKLDERTKELEDKPKVALGMFIKGLITACGTLIAGWLFTKGIK